MLALAAFLALASANADQPVEKWLGKYDPFSRSCERDILTIDSSTFSWGDCRMAPTRVISASQTHLTFSVSPDAACGWAGWIVELRTPSPDPRAVEVRAYRNVADYHAREDKAYCAYGRVQ